MTLAEALALVDLEPGQSYRCRVRGLDIDVHVLDEKSFSIRVTKEDSFLKDMKPFTIEECDLAPGTLSEAEEDMKLLSRLDEPDVPDTPESVMKDEEK